MILSFVMDFLDLDFEIFPIHYFPNNLKIFNNQFTKIGNEAKDKNRTFFFD